MQAGWSTRVRAAEPQPELTNERKTGIDLDLGCALHVLLAGRYHAHAWRTLPSFLPSYPALFSPAKNTM